MTPPPFLYTVEQAADLLQVAPRWLKDNVAAHAIPCTRLGKHIRFTAADLDLLIAQRQQSVINAPRSLRSA